MPFYNYICENCLKKIAKKHGFKIDVDDITYGLPEDVFVEYALFEARHSMHPTDEERKEATKCPRCGSHKTQQTYYGNNVTGYIRGYGWLDKNGARRDMHKYKLMNDDPYARHRVPGEVDHIKTTLEKSGKHNPNTKYFT